MTWPDFVTIGLCVVMAVVESKCGFVAALLGLIGIVLTIEIAGPSYRSLFPGLSYATGYVATVLIGVALLALVTFLVRRYAPTDIGSFDSPLAGLLGVFIGLVLAHALYGAVILGYAGGMHSAVYAKSAFAGQIYELNGVHGFLGFMGKIGSTDVAR